MMNLSRYRQKHFWLEFTVLAVQLIPYFANVNAHVIHLCTISLSIAKFRVEGLRPNALLFIAAYLWFTLIGDGVVHLLLLASFFYVTLKLRVYDIPYTKQNIGYRKVHLGETDLEIFYPTTLEINGRKNKRLFANGVWNTMFEIVNKDTETKSKLPWWAMYFTCHYYTRMEMHNTY